MEKIQDVAGDEFEREANAIIDCAEERSEKKFPAAQRKVAIAEMAEILQRAWDDAYERARQTIEEAHP